MAARRCSGSWGSPRGTRGSIRDDDLPVWHLLVRRGLDEALLTAVNKHLAAWSLRLREGTIVDTGILVEPASALSPVQARNRETH